MPQVWGDETYAKTGSWQTLCGVAREELNEGSVAAASSGTDCEVPAEGGGCLASCTFPALSQPVL